MADTAPPLIGWPLLALPEDDGTLRYPGLEASVRDAIRVILSTTPGEQLMRPDFGAGLERLLHEPNTLATRARLRELVVDALARWERRIVVDRVDVWELPEDASALRVEIGYRIVRTGANAALALTMQLQG
jgi:phage baseplate assembly protein W